MAYLLSLSIIIFLSRWYIKEIVSSSTPNKIKARILPPSDTFTMSEKNTKEAERNNTQGFILVPHAEPH
jgi:hypothetical protein